MEHYIKKDNLKGQTMKKYLMLVLMIVTAIAVTYAEEQPVQINPLSGLMESLYFLYTLAIVGMITHFLRKAVQGESLGDIKNFFWNNPKRTFIAWVATSVGFIAYVGLLPVGTVKDVMIVFGIGYSFDSFFNKWEKPTP
jgi:hypothetical protein